MQETAKGQRFGKCHVDALPRGEYLLALLDQLVDLAVQLEILGVGAKSLAHLSMCTD